MSSVLATAALWIGGLLTALQVAGDDPRWRMRESAAAYLDHIQAQRELRLAERLKQGRLHAEFAAFAADLCLPEPGARLRQLAAFAEITRPVLERRRLALECRDTWTIEQPDGSLRQHWTIVEHEQVRRMEQIFSGPWVWQEKELALIFRGTPRADGTFDVVPEWTDARRNEDRLPPQLARLLDLLSPDARMLVSSAVEARR
ncbi:MAG: hypothetical protein JNM84_19075 [Planctomycetes bacterium]|nr:hypothetical protein [Planctomycetota bacterium]